MIQVTAAILRNNNRVFICQRPANKSCGLLWEFPGGKVEPGESLEQCLIRECQEELGVTIGNLHSFDTVTLPEKGLCLHFFTARIQSGSLIQKEHADMKWITRDEMKNYTFCPSDTQMLARADLDKLFDTSRQN